jgi:catechol 2,3-dioxygenase-like lactoylglutathione lyase family enzyme
MPEVAAPRVAQITGIVPQLLVDDLDRAIAFYRDQLGFAVDFIYESFYAAVSRDGFAIHLKHAPKCAVDRAHRKEHEHLDAYISVSGIRGVVQRIADARDSCEQAARRETVGMRGFLRRGS